MAEDSDRKLDLANEAGADTDLDTNPVNQKSDTAEKPDLKPATPAISKPSLVQQLLATLDHVKKYTSVIVTLVIGGGLIYVFFSVTTIVQGGDDPAYRNQQSEKSIRSSFDRQTIDKINQLRSRDDSQSINLPSGRISPFVE